ncbi:efflux RND transporter periplasmic adaptor subunit [Desulfogranum marinum]|uniref:efflux RND transporter periplasmic adaptor subunit n=1 Tax=Desulfogranum marinum TaxID=453220 RepID=UPI0029C682E0|nr:efflux RND transporter periplasmic adaptor subunit [Desulfogranum marinum]
MNTNQSRTVEKKRLDSCSTIPHIKQSKFAFFVWTVFLPMTVLIAGGLITLHLFETGPQAKPMPQSRHTVLVDTIPALFGTYPTLINAMGVVKPAQTIDLKPQISGEVTAISGQLVPGGNFTKGDTLLQINPKDYQLIVRQQASQVAQAKNNIELEKGNQLVAQRELDLLGEQVSELEKSLMLRQPQLNNLKNDLDVAQAKYEQAQLDLERTKIMAPFNGMIQSREVDIGTWVSSSSSLATLVGTDSYWVEVSVPENQLQWIAVPAKVGQQGSAVKIYNPAAWGAGNFRQGQVIQLLPALESEGRMARLLIAVDDPMAIEQANSDKPQVLIDSFVRVEIEGLPVADALEISREFLHNGKELWVLKNDGTLDVRAVTIAFKNQESVLITGGIDAKEELIVSNLSTPVPGMLLRRSTPVASGMLSENETGNQYVQHDNEKK